MNFLKTPEDFAMKVLELNGGDHDEASNAVIREINGTLKTCPTSWVREVLRVLARPKVVAGWDVIEA